jgi:flagellar basal-body rod modification protein FlgD
MNVDSKQDIFKAAGIATTVAAPEAKKKNSLGPDDFLRLMTTQMKFQNPLKPQDGAEILSQLSQLSSITGMQELQETFSQFRNLMTSDQALRAAGLVGHPVLVSSAKGVLPQGGALQGQAVLPASSSNVTVSVTDGVGQVMKTFHNGPQAAGEVPFVWDGVLADGSAAPPGVYTLRAEALIDGKLQPLETRALARVNSVRLGSPGDPMELNLASLGEMTVDKILEIF